MSSRSKPSLRLESGNFVICRFPADAPILATLGDWKGAGFPDPSKGSDQNAAAGMESGWWSLTRTADETSLVIAEERVPELAKRLTIDIAELTCSPARRLIQVKGPLPLEWVGIMADLSQVLSAAEVSIFCIATFDTDYLLIESDRIVDAINALVAAGYEVEH